MMIQTIKVPVKKCIALGHDFNLAKLLYRAAPLILRILLPKDLFFSGKYSVPLPVHSLQTTHSVHTTCKLMMVNQVKLSERHRSAKDLLQLHVNHSSFMALQYRDSKWGTALSHLYFL